MLGIILFTLVFYSGVVASGSGDDFTNNLFSDLSPLLSLFGERFANQFMSQSMGWLDNIVFAMAPLGILTAMVAAIRVGGPSWLKAVIGRARENRATAELELMSSTSHEVGELWNGQTIVRTQGRPEIQQLIFLEHASNGPEFGLFSIPVAESGKYLKSENLKDPLVEWCCTLKVAFKSLFTRDRRKPADEERLDTVAGETPDSGDTQPKAAPSISLNLHGGSKTGDLCFAAAFGVVLQSGVLVFTGLSVYYPTWNSRFRKDGLPVRSYAYPVMSIGTVLLTFGLVICSAVVERSTTETKWVAGPNYGELFEPRSRTPGEQPSNQHPRSNENSDISEGDSFYFSETPGTPSLEIRSTRTRASEETLEDQSGSPSRASTLDPPTLTNETPTVSLLVRMGSMAARLLLPAKPSHKLQARILWLQKSHTVSDQSFDSFVIIAGDIKDSLLMSQRSTSHRIDSTTSKKIKAPSKLRKFASGPTELFTVLGVGLSLVGFIFQFQGLRGLHWSASIAQLVAIFLMTAVRAWVRRGLIVEPTAERVLDGYEMDWLAREMTAKPKFWSPSGNRTDEQLHESAQTMSQNGQDGKCDISWTISTGPSALACRGIWASRTVEHHGAAQKAMKVRQRLGDLTRWTGPASKPAISVASAISTIMEKLAITPPTEAGIFYWCLDASFTEKDQIGFAVSQSDGKWEADATAIEAAISLWAFHIRTTEECEKTQKSVDIATSTQDRSHHDWLQEDTLLRRQTRRILGPKTKALLMDLSLWIGDHLNPQPLETGDRATEEKETFLGFVGLTDEQSIDQPEAVLDHSPQREQSTSPTPMSVVLEAPLEQILAQHLFSAFMWAIAPYVSNDKIARNNTTVEPGSAHSIGATPIFSRLRNKELSEIVSLIQKAGLGSIDEVFMCLIPPLSCENKLPTDAVVDFVRQDTRSMELARNWDKVIAKHDELSRFCDTLGPDHLASRRATAVRAHLTQVIQGTMQLWQNEKRRGDLTRLARQDTLLKIEAYKAKEDIFQLAFMTEKRSELCKKPGTLASDYREFGLQWQDKVEDFHEYLFLVLGAGAERRERGEILESGRIGSADFDQGDSRSGATSSSSFDEDEDGASVNIDAVDIFGWTYLHYFALFDRLGSLKTRLKLKANPNVRDIADYTPLHYACEQGHERIVRELLEYAEINAQGLDGMSPLHCAAKLGHSKIVRVLIQNGAMSDIQDFMRRTPLHWAAHGGFPEVIEFLVRNGATLSAREDYGRTPLHLATFSIRARNKTIQKLLRMGADKNATDNDGSTSLHIAVGLDAREVVQLLLDSKLGGNAALEITDAAGRTPLHVAAEYGHNLVAKHLLAQGADINVKALNSGRTALHLAAYKGHEETVRLLIQANADIHTTDGEGLIPLELATRNQKQGAVDALVENVQDIVSGNSLRYSLDEPARTIFEAFLEQKRFDGIRLCLQARVAIENQKETVLHQALLLDTEVMVQLLIGLIQTLGPRLSPAARYSLEELEWVQNTPRFPEVSHQTSFQLRSVADVFRVYKILLRKLHYSLCYLVLDCEAFWLQTAAERSDDVAISEDDPDSPYVVATIPMVSSHPVRKMRFIMKSHDQGWGGDVEHPKTPYDGSWTWFEAGVIPRMPKVGHESETQLSQTRPDSAAEIGEVEGFQERSERRPEEQSIPDRLGIQRNVCASSRTQEHIVTWSRDNPEPKIQQWIASLQPGDTIGVFPKAKYPAWVNHVEYVKIEVFIAWGGAEGQR